MGKNFVRTDGNGGLIIPRWLFGSLIIIIIALLGSFADGLVQGTEMRDDIKCLKQELDKVDLEYPLVMTGIENNINQNEAEIYDLKTTVGIINTKLTNIEEDINDVNDVLHGLDNKIEKYLLNGD